MKKTGNIILGLVLVAVGVLIGGNVLSFWEIPLFFRGWWALFIIVPCLVSMFGHGIDAGNCIGISIGVMLLLAAQGVITYGQFGMLVFPVILVFVGLSIVFRRASKAARPPQEVDTEGLTKYTAVFSEQNVVFPREPFGGAAASAVFGSVRLDLRQAVIDSDVYLSVSPLFGGVDVYLPPQVRAEVSCAPFFGGVTNHRSEQAAGGSPTVYIGGNCIFGGVEIY